MRETAGHEDAWVLARLTALERENRRLWSGLAALGVALVGICAAAAFLATSTALSGSRGSGATGDAGARLVAGDLTLSGALRVVDDAGRSLVFIGREPATGAGSGQAVIGLFAGAGDSAPTQTIRLATSPKGSALSLSTPDGTSSSSVFAGQDGALLELRRGEIARLISERDPGAATRRRAPEPSAGPRAEAPASAPAALRGVERGALVDLNDPALQPIGDGLYVGRLSLSDQSGVLRVQGRLVNATSVEQTRAEFRLSVAGRELPFIVARIGAGGSTAFTLEIPSASAGALREARIRWVRSTLSYLSE